MSFPKFFLALMTICALYGCKDRGKSKQTNTVKNTNQVDTITPANKVVIPGNDDMEYNFSKIETISQKELKPFLREYGDKNPENKIKIITDYGNIIVKLFDDTPLHRANFIRLVKLGYFNTTFFHRVVEGFVIQGGNSDKVITQKIRAAVGDFLIPNEASPAHPHVRGAFSMSKYLDQNISDASSPFEFFIVQSQNGAHHLDGEHTVFGKVVDGMEVVDEISKLETGDREWPLENVYIDIEIVE